MSPASTEPPRCTAAVGLNGQTSRKRFLSFAFVDPEGRPEKEGRRRSSVCWCWIYYLAWQKGRKEGEGLCNYWKCATDT